MQSYYTFIALDIARERAHEAELRRLVAGDRATFESDRSVRRSLASAIAAVSRMSGRIARRLDDRAALSTH